MWYLLGISTTYKLAKELLAKDDDFLTVMVGDREYSIKSILRTTTCSNIDDRSSRTVLVCEELTGNIVRWKNIRSNKKDMIKLVIIFIIGVIAGFVLHSLCVAAKDN